MKKILTVLFLAGTVVMAGCNSNTTSTPVVKKAVARVVVGADGNTVEQTNVKKRLEEDSRIGATKHLYIISAYSGQTIIYSTVEGKVTSSGKRLTPTMVSQDDYYIPVVINGVSRGTEQVMGDDGTYGSSVPYLYWWDTAGKYHQHFVSGGQIIHISDQPFRAKSVIMNVEVQN